MTVRDNSIPQNDGEISLKELILKLKNIARYLISRWKIFFFFSVLSGGLGFLYASVKKPVFTASTTFVLEEGDGGGGISQYLGLASMVGIDLNGNSGGIFQGDNIIELYKSRLMIRKALLSKIPGSRTGEFLIDRYMSMNELRKKWNKKPELRKVSFINLKSFTRLQDSILLAIIDDIKKNYLFVQKPDKKLSIIQVDVKSSNEEFSKTFNDALVNTVNTFYIETKTKRSLQNVIMLQQKTDSVRAVMTGAIYTSVSIADATPNLNPTRQIERVAPMQKSQFTAETNKAIYSELLKNLELSKMALRKETPLVQVVDYPIYPLKKEKLGRITAAMVGALLGGFLLMLFLLVKKFYRSILAT